jgi:hypothetical protein
VRVALFYQRPGSGVHALSKPYINSLNYVRAVSEAQNQVDLGTDVTAMVKASGELRDLEPEHRLVAALETRIRRASQIEFRTLRAKLAAHTGIN